MLDMFSTCAVSLHIARNANDRYCTWFTMVENELWKHPRSAHSKRPQWYTISAPFYEKVMRIPAMRCRLKYAQEAPEQRRPITASRSSHTTRGAEPDR